MLGDVLEPALGWQQSGIVAAGSAGVQAAWAHKYMPESQRGRANLEGRGERDQIEEVLMVWHDASAR